MWVLWFYTWRHTLATATYCYRPHLSPSKVCIECVRGSDNYYNTCSELQQHLDAFLTGYGPRPLTARELLQCFGPAGHFGQSRLDLDAFFGHWLKDYIWDLAKELHWNLNLENWTKCRNTLLIIE